MSDHFGILVYIRGLNFNHWLGYTCWASISKSNSVILICGLHEELVFPMIQLPFFKDNKWFDSNKPRGSLLFSQPTTNQQLPTKRLFFQRLSDHRSPTHRLSLHQLTDQQPWTTDTPTHRPPTTDPWTTYHRFFFFCTNQLLQSFYIPVLQVSKRPMKNNLFSPPRFLWFVFASWLVFNLMHH